MAEVSSKDQIFTLRSRAVQRLHRQPAQRHAVGTRARARHLCIKTIAKMDTDDGAIPIGVINAQVIVEGRGQRCGPFITTGLAYSRPIEPLEWAS